MSRQMRRLFLSSLVCGALTCTGLSGTAQAAMDQQVQLLQPSSGWAISRIAGSSGGAPYCAMARRFSKDMILTFARNPDSEISVAVDFQRDMLNTNQNYFTVLKPGYSQDRAFNVRPVSSKALVIRMGADGDFFDALSRSERLNIDLDGEQYSFVMPDMAGGLRDVQDCLSMADQAVTPYVPSRHRQPEAPAADLLPPGGSEPASLSQTQGSPTAQDYASASIADEPPSVPQPVAQAPLPEPDLQPLREENAQLKSELETQRHDLDRRLAAQQNESSQTAALSDRIRDLEAQNDTLRRQASDSATRTAQMARAAAEPDPKVQQEMALLREENARLKNDANARDPLMEHDLAALRVENERLKAEGKKPDLAVEQELASLRNENENLKRQGKSPDPAVQHELEALRTENGSLKQDIGKLNAQIEREASLATAKDEDQDATAERLNGRIRSLEQENARLIEAANTVPAAPAQDKATLAKLESVQAQLEDQTQRYNESQREVARLNKDIAELQDQAKDKEQQLADARGELSKIRQDYERKFAVAESQEQAEQLHEDLGRQLSEARQAIKQRDQKLSEVQERLAQAQSRLDSVELAKADQAPLPSPETEQVRLAAVVDADTKADPVSAPEAKREARTEEDDRMAGIRASDDQETPPPQEPAQAEAKAGEGYPPAKPEEAHAGADDARALEMAAIKPAGVPSDQAPADGAPVPRIWPEGLPPVQMTVRPSRRFITPQDMETILTGADLSLNKKVEPMGDISDDHSVLTWETGPVFGTAEQNVMASPDAFDGQVRNYIERTKSRCKGDFAAVPGAEEKQGAVLQQTYEIACVDPGSDGATASLLFFSRDDVFTIIAHESNVRSMGKAMDARDKVAAALANDGKMASR